MKTIYDTIGKSYLATRAADPRITERLIDLLHLPSGSSILDVGAGTGNYSQAMAEAGYHVSAIEPSQVMREQGKEHLQLNWFAGCAEDLPFEDEVFDGVMMTLCMHHFADWQKAFIEAQRVVGSGPIVLLSFDAEFKSEFWLLDYFPRFAEDDKKVFPKLSVLKEFATSVLETSFEISRFPLPIDLVDHFLAAGWARPEVYLDEEYQDGISSFSKIDKRLLKQGLKKLSNDLESGEWHRRYGFLKEKELYDVGYVFLKMKK